jgi:thioredoxin-dependent peroxiredoxin
MKKFILSTFVLIFTPLLMCLAPGDVAPDISAKNQDGKIIHIGDHKGHYVLLYFYPKDETAGCTKEACSLRDNYEKIKQMNALVYGVSRQDAESHKKFIAHHKLPFDLLVDSDGAIGKAYGVDSMPGVGFSKRESLLIGTDGKVIKHYVNVNPETHVDEVLADLKASGATKN